MNLLRNPEIKRQLIIFLLFTVAVTIGGAFIGIACAAYILAVSFAASAVYLISAKKRYDKLARLSEKINLLLHGGDPVDFSSFQEGELAILSSEIDKMAVRLREQAAVLERDKLYLKNSLANISHQLRTPLTSLRMIVARFRDNDLTADESVLLTMKIESILSRVEWLIDLLLKMSRLESGTVFFERKYIAVEDIIKKSVESFEILLELREITLDVSVKNNSGLIGDLGWLTEALENIIKNCIEHTPTGGEIKIYAAENPIYTEIIISDSGQGIKPVELPHIFERFYQGEGSSNSNFGIGLALAQMIIHEQNGTIKAANNQENGAIFTIRLYKGDM